MYTKGLAGLLFLAALIAIILMVAGPSPRRHMRKNSFEEINLALENPMKRRTIPNPSYDNSPHTLSVSNQALSSIDIFIQPKILNLSTKGKIFISWIRLPEEYDPHDIDHNSLGLSVLACHRCENIYPTCQSPIHMQYLSVFPRQDLVDKILAMKLKLPARLNLRIYGELNDGTPFEGFDTIRIVK